MPYYIIYFNQQWVGEHDPEWFESRGPLARKVVEEMKESGVLVFAGGLDEEIQNGFSSDALGEINGPISNFKSQFIGGLTIINAADDSEAKKWGAKIGVACGWPQEIRKFKGN